MTKPLRQGALDGLCGIYSVVNAVNHLMTIAPPKALNEELFRLAARSLPRGIYPDVLWEGTTQEQVMKMVQRAIAHMRSEYDVGIAAVRPFVGQRFRSRASFFGALLEAWTSRHCVFVVWIDWAWGGSHWSVLNRLETGRLLLIDSDGVSPLPTRKLRIAGASGDRIDPGATIMLTLTDIGGEPFDVLAETA